ncbi:helix-turn-helix domain-containing protein [Streptomyces sp. TRM68416]|nr:helix-turn-helix domain-containing protein [Streptomyces sp. TRM68416]
MVYFTTAEVAARYRTAPSTVRYWRHIGYGPKGTKVGRRFLYPAASIEEFDQQLLAATASHGAGPACEAGPSARNDEEAACEAASPVEQSAPTAK